MRHPTAAYLWCSVALVWLSGCAVTSRQYLAAPATAVTVASAPQEEMSPPVALPSSQAPRVELAQRPKGPRAFSPPPDADSSLPPDLPAAGAKRVADPPTLVEQVVRQQQANVFLEESERHFRSGEQLFADGNLEAARDEFDAAVETLLQAAHHFPDRVNFQVRFDMLLERIHEFDKAAARQWKEEREEEETSEARIPEMTFPVDPRFRDRVVEEIRAAASQIPLVATDAVLAYVDYLTNSRKGRATFISGMERAGRYREMIYRIFDEEGVPRELIHMAQAESGFRTNAVSPARATGMWQFMKFRGNEYGLEQSRYADDRMDPEKATRAAARHLMDLYHEFGDWLLAMAAYNCGPVNVARAVERTGYADFWELRRLNVLPNETKNYVPIILAMIIVAKNPAKYGFEGIEPDRPLDYDKVALTAPTHLQLAADLADCTLAEVRALNPSILRDVAPAGYELRIPKGKGMAFRQLVELVPEERRAQWRVHKVAEGEDLTLIARLYKAKVESIRGVNAGAAEDLQPGELLVIPVAVPERKAPKAAARSRKPTKETTTRRATRRSR